MNLDNIENKLNQIENIEDDQKFIIYLIMKKCTVLLRQAKNLIDQHRGTFISPLLRQVFEYTIITAGFDGFITLDDFINHQKNAKLVKKIRDKFDDFIIKNHGQQHKNTFKAYTKMIYSVLSEYTHSNIDNLVRFSLDEYCDNQKMLSEEANVLYTMVEQLFFILTNEYLDTNIEIKEIDTNDLLNLIKKSRSINDISDPVLKHLLEIKGIDQRYKNKTKKIINQLKHCK